ncbi:MAG: DNA polymerase III subunit delta', partial [Pseudomonadota bacterium]
MSLSDETVLEPAEQSKLFGHGPAERTLAQASEGDRLAHAWLFAGPEGIGKMTLAIRFARHLLGADDSAGDRLNGSSQDP